MRQATVDMESPKGYKCLQLYLSVPTYCERNPCPMLLRQWHVAAECFSIKLTMLKKTKEGHKLNEERRNNYKQQNKEFLKFDV